MSLDGTVQIAKAVFARLKRDGVADAIKDKYWSNQVNDPENYRAIWKYRAAPSVQLPYAVYGLITDTLIGQTSGTGKAITIDEASVTESNQDVQERQAQIQFLCYAPKKLGIDETAAIFVAEKIDAAMTNGKLSFSESTRFITLTRQVDFEGSDDEESYVHGLQYQIDYEIIINGGRLRSAT